MHSSVNFIVFTKFYYNFSSKMHKTLKDLDIGQPLNTYWVLYRYDKVGQKVDPKRQLIQFFKFLYCVILQLIFITSKAILIIGDKNDPKIQFVKNFDAFGFVDPTSKSTTSTYLAAISCASMSIMLHMILNHSDKKHYKWFDLVKALSGQKRFDEIGLYEESVVCRYITKIVTVKKFLKIGIYCTLILFSMFALAITLLKVGVSLEFFIFGTSTVILYATFGGTFLSNLYFSFLYFFVVVSYCKIQIHSLNQSLSDERLKNIFFKTRNFDTMLKKQNTICTCITMFNKFWRKYLFTIYYFLTPVNLIAVQLIFFEPEVHIMLKVTLISFLTSSILFNLFFNLFTASINVEFNKSYRLLFNCYLKRLDVLNMNRKLKLINAMERCSDKKRQIGFSCADQFVVTKQIAIRMFILVCRFFLLTHKLHK